jgi:hydrogenase large subunit
VTGVQTCALPISRDGAGVPGPLEGALAGLEVGEAAARSPMVQHVVRSFDPCMVCTAQ